MSLVEFCWTVTARVATLFLHFCGICERNMPPSSALRALYRVIARFVTGVSTLGDEPNKIAEIS